VKKQLYLPKSVRIILLLLAINMLGVVQFAHAQTEADTQVIISQGSDIVTLDPKFISGRETQNVLRLMFDSLYHRDDNMQIVPWLATSIENVDDLTWRFNLRDDVTFSNGNDFKANDVKFSVERLLEDDSQFSARGFVDKVEVVDDYTVDISTKEPFAAFMTRVVLWHMTDEEYFNEVGADGFLSDPVGSGPYTFVEWVKDEQLVLEANPNYWRGAQSIETVIFRPIPEASTRLAALEAGDVNIIAEVPTLYVNQPAENVEIATIPGTRAFFLALNVNVAPFDDVRVRQAMNYAIDTEALVEFVLNGLARTIDNPLLPEAFGYSETPVYSYDPELALSLLADAGYADGFEMELDTYAAGKEMSEAIAGQLSEVGITANITVYEGSALTARKEPGYSQTYFGSWGNSEADADGILSKQFYSKRYGCDLVTYDYPAPESGYGDAAKGCYYTGYGNTDVDTAVEEGKLNVDPAVRQAAYAQALEIIVEEAPWVFLYNPSEVFAYRGVEGWTPRSDALFNLENASASE
jgi:peptide/nickel transport system substrate-binding protein